MAGITEPVDRALYLVLRRAVLEHATTEERRAAYAPTLHVGLPGRPHRRFEIEPDEPLDHALRVDVAQALLRDDVAANRVPLVWLTRAESDERLDCDVAWTAAVRAAAAELGVDLGLVVVTARSWYDPVTGVGRRWKRIRSRTSAA